jgi:hypothetical protein
MYEILRNGILPAEHGAQPFTDPMSRPLMIIFNRKIYINTTGIVVIAAPAHIIFQAATVVPFRFATATVTGWEVTPLVRVSPNRNSFQILVNWNIATTANPGKDNGRIIFV